MSTRILLAADHAVMGNELGKFLQKQADMEVVGEVQDPATAISLSEELQPRIVIMSVGTPDSGGLEATRQIAGRVKSAKIIILSNNSEKKFVTAMLRAGVSGYLLQDCACRELIEAIRAVHAGQFYLNQKVTSILVHDYLHNIKSEFGPYRLLTARERDVFQALQEGDEMNEIASSLNVSAKTIRTYVRRIMHKLKVSSIAELAKHRSAQDPTE